MPTPFTVSPKIEFDLRNNNIQLPPPVAKGNDPDVAPTSTALRAEIPDSDDFSDSSSNDPILRKVDTEVGQIQQIDGSDLSELDSKDIPSSSTTITSAAPITGLSIQLRPALEPDPSDQPSHCAAGQSTVSLESDVTISQAKNEDTFEAKQTGTIEPGTLNMEIQQSNTMLSSAGDPNLTSSKLMPGPGDTNGPVIDAPSDEDGDTTHSTTTANDFPGTRAVELKAGASQIHEKSTEGEESLPIANGSALKEQTDQPPTAHFSVEKSSAALTSFLPKPVAMKVPNSRKKSPNTTFSAPEGSQSKEILKAEMKAMKISSIQARISSLEAEIASKRAKLEEVTKGLKYPAAETVKKHIKLLHDYNDIRDVGQGLVGMIADNRGVTIGTLYDEFGVGLQD